MDRVAATIMLRYGPTTSANMQIRYLHISAIKGQEQSLNCYRLYSRLASSDKAIPTSIVACGDGIWNGAGDRGDTSMYLYGLCRYLLTTGDRKTANELMPSIEKAVDYVVKNITDDFIVKVTVTSLKIVLKAEKQIFLHHALHTMLLYHLDIFTGHLVIM